MPGNKIETTATVIAITDPGDVDREQHLWGDRLMIGIGNILAWLFPVLMLAIVTQVIIRRIGFNQAWLDEAQWWLYGVAMLTGFGYAISTQSHVRVDIFHQNFSQQKKSKIEVLAIGWMLIPFMILMTDVLYHYAAASWRTWEGSDSPNGLHMLFLLKTALPILFVVAIIAAGSVFLRHMRLWRTPTPIWIAIGALPSLWFLAERTAHYILHNVMALLNPELNARAVAKLPIMDHTMWYGLAVLVIIVGIASFKNKISTEAA